MKKDRLYDILETMKKNQLEAVLSHFGALSDHSADVPQISQTSARKIGKPAISRMAQKIESVIRLFSG